MNHFLTSRNMARPLVAARDVMTLNLDGNPDADDGRRPYLERFIHGETYRARPDVQAGRAQPHPVRHPLRRHPERQAAARPPHRGRPGVDVPTFEIRDPDGPATDMPVRDAHLEEVLAKTLATACVALMRGHGIVVVGHTLRAAVYHAGQRGRERAAAGRCRAAWSARVSERRGDRRRRAVQRRPDRSNVGLVGSRGGEGRATMTVFDRETSSAASATFGSRSTAEGIVMWNTALRCDPAPLNAAGTFNSTSAGADRIVFFFNLGERVSP